MRYSRAVKKPPTPQARKKRLREQNPDLGQLMDNQQLTLAEAEAAALARAREQLRQQQEERGRQPGDVWLSNNLPIPETSEDHAIYCRYVLAHVPALADHVISGNWPLHMAVLFVGQHSCPFPCDQHVPLSAGQEAAFLQAVAAGESAEKAKDVLGYAAHLVPEIKL